MQVRDIKEWAGKMLLNDNLQFMELGVKETRLQKTRAFLKGIVDHTEIIIRTSEKNGMLVANVEQYLKYLKDYGLPIPKEPETEKGPVKK